MATRTNLFGALRELSLLLVEDDELIRDSLQLFFESEGCRLNVRESAEDGLAAIRDQAYDIIITDFRLPGMDGLDFLKSVQDLCPAAQKILLTAYMNEQVLAEAFRLGVHQFIEKPFSSDDLEEALAQLVERRANILPSA